jgi:hypothetical protein
MAKLKFAAITIAVLAAVSYIHEILYRLPAYVRLHNDKPFYVAESIDKVAGACLCLITIWLMRRTGREESYERLLLIRRFCLRSRSH